MFVATLMSDSSNVREITSAFLEFGMVTHRFVLFRDLFLSFVFAKLRFLIRSAFSFCFIKKLRGYLSFSNAS